MRAFLPTQVTTGTAEHSPALPGDAATAHGGAHAPGPWGPRRTIPLLVGCGLFLAATIAGGTWAILADLRNRALGSAERELQNIVMVLAEQTDRTFQSIELVQKSLTDHVRDAAINSGEDYVRLLETLHQDPGRTDIAWLLGIDEDVTNEDIRLTEVRNWIDRLVVPTMAQRH